MVDNAKLARLQQSVRIGTPRRKVKKVHKEAGVDDKKLQGTLKKLNVQPIPQIEEVNFFRDDGKITHFSHPTVHAAVPSNTYAIYGHGQEKELAELVPGILTQLGPDSLNSLRQLAEQYQALQSQAQGNTGAAGSGEGEGEKQQGDDEIPDLVESFENKVE